MKNSLYIIALTCFVGAPGCAKDPSKDAPKAQIGKARIAAAKSAPAKAVKAKKKAPPKAKVAVVTPTAKKDVNTLALMGSVGFVGSKVTGSHDGIFKKWAGKVVMGKSLEDAQISIEADVATVISDPKNRKPWSGKLDKHLKSADFFHAEKFPKAMFVSKSITKTTGTNATHTVTGDLTMRGTTRAVTFPATISHVAGKFMAKADFTINRSDWKIVYKGKADDLIRDGVVLKIDVTGAP